MPYSLAFMYFSMFVWGWDVTMTFVWYGQLILWCPKSKLIMGYRLCGTQNEAMLPDLKEMWFDCQCKTNWNVDLKELLGFSRSRVGHRASCASQTQSVLTWYGCCPWWAILKTTGGVSPWQVVHIHVLRICCGFWSWSYSWSNGDLDRKLYSVCKHCWFLNL